MPKMKIADVKTWVIPRSDESNKEPVPDWVTDAFMRGDLDVNTLGGVTLNQGRWSQTGLTGDVLVFYTFTDNGLLEIIDKDEFEIFFEE